MTLFGHTLDAGHVTLISGGLVAYGHKLVRYWPTPDAANRWRGMLFDSIQDQFGYNDRIGQRNNLTTPPDANAPQPPVGPDRNTAPAAPAETRQPAATPPQEKK